MSDDAAEDSGAHDAFYKAFAIAMLRWQYAEHNLFGVFHHLQRATDIRASCAVYYKLDSFGQKLRIVDSTAKVMLTDVPLALWTALEKRLRTESQERNFLAHLTAVADFQGDGPEFELVLSSGVYVPPQLVRKRTKKYNATELQRLGDRFSVLSHDVEEFAKVLG